MLWLVGLMLLLGLGGESRPFHADINLPSSSILPPKSLIPYLMLSKFNFLKLLIAIFLTREKNSGAFPL